MMRPFLLSLLLVAPVASTAQQSNVPRIESSDCIYKADDPQKTHCGFLVVPENRDQPEGRTIRLPYIYVESDNPAKSPDPVLYTGGGPGVSSLHPVTSIARRSLLRNRDYIAFEQRGTHFAQPNLECEGEGKAIQDAYLEHRSIDDAVLSAVRQCREKLTREGIDLSAYNTDESATDIEDLRRLLRIDSLNLMGISYSGGLMLAVPRKVSSTHPLVDSGLAPSGVCKHR
jgi:pimeloyl-ACP methyl ester carboxylesterase